MAITCQNPGCSHQFVAHTGKGRPAQFCSHRCQMRAHRAKAQNSVTPSPVVTKIAHSSRQALAPFPWFGGKQHLAPLLASLLPPHAVYVEVFGGAASLLWAKAPSPLEIYNDLDSNLVNFFRVLRNPAQAAQLHALLDLTPYSRQEYLDCRASWRDAADPVERARRWFVALVMSFSKSSGVQHGWAFTRTPNAQKPRAFRGWAQALPSFTQRLALVQIEHGSYADIFARYDAPGACFYCDPPYLPETRKDTAHHEYAHEMSRDEHLHLLETVKAARGKVLLSGYDSALYQEALRGWDCIKVAALNWSAHAKYGRTPRTECIWLSPNIVRQPTLWAVTKGQVS